MNNDLISRSALKEEMDRPFWEKWEWEFICKSIDNAPTVPQDCSECKRFDSPFCEIKFDNEKLKELVDEAKAEVLASIKQGNWIPVDDRLPEDMQNVLIWFEYYRYGDFNCMYKTYGFGYVCDGKWSDFINGKTGWQDYRVIAWQPLPEPYEKGGAE